MKQLFFIFAMMFALIPAYSVIDYNSDVEFATFIDYTSENTATSDEIGIYDLETNNGNTTINTAGGYIDFDGIDDRLDFPSVNLTVPYTVSFMVNVDTPVGDKNFFEKYDSSDNRFFTFVSNPGWDLRTVLDNGPIRDLACTTNLAADTWYLVTVTDDGVNSKQYYNLVQCPGSLATNGNVVSDAKLAFGGSIGLGARHLDGLISQFYIFNKSLDSSEITQHYNNVIANTKFNPFTSAPTITVNTPINGFNYTFDVQNLTFDVDTNINSSCQYEFEGSNTSMTSSDNQEHTVFFNLGAETNFSKTFDVDFHCQSLETNETSTNELTFYRQQEPLDLDILVPTQNQVFNAGTMTINYFLQTNYVAECSYKTNNETVFTVFQNTNHSVHTHPFSVINSTLNYTTTFSCMGLFVNETVNGTVMYFVDELSEQVQTLGFGSVVTDTTGQLPAVGNHIGGFLDNMGGPVAFLVLSISLIVVITAFIGGLLILRNIK